METSELSGDPPSLK